MGMEDASYDVDNTEDVNEILLQVCRVLSFTVIINTLIYKLPQMVVIIRTSSSFGISLRSVIIEWLAYTIMLTYQFAMGFPLETYFESNVTVFQDLILILLILKNRKLIEPSILRYYFVYFVFFISMAMRMYPDAVMYISISATTPMLCWSKLNQLLLILKSGNAGSVSAITWFIAAYNTAVRILTTVVITKDFPMFVNLVSSEVFNVAVFCSVIYYSYINKPPPQRRRYY
ncbi:unnamed protein product [Lymnaea stagnalis]|uniref:Solute carrier family 66 member 3 n=1 Tax=Lymnaea stagnalis TaxID=6523 RepID=A0AAV2H7I9_LYMST